jgi:hypothetical protein
MAITENQYTGNGSTVLYSFTFPYLETTDIKVSLDGTVTTAYTLANATTIEFNTAPANGVAIRIYRVTDDAALSAQFYPGSAIRSTDLNDNFTQNLYVTQESNRDATQAITTADAATATANTALSNSSAAVSTANAASASAAAAVSTANTASSNASAAVSTANTASTNATTAVNTANAATATANSAASDAATAISTANSAVSTANTASTTATNAVNTANSASSAASSAVSTANTASSNASAAVSTANTASSNATTAVNTANTAISTANAASAAVASAVIYQPVVDLAALALLTPVDGDFFELQDSTGADTDPNITGVPGGLVGAAGLTFRLRYDDPPAEYVFLGYFANDSETRYLKEAGDTMTGALGVTTGTAAAPSVFISGDPNTGIYSPGADQVAVATNGVGRLFVDASGRVGVGNASPGTQASEANALVVGSGTGNQGISIVSGTGSEGGLYFADGGGGGAYRGKVLYDHVTDSLQLDTANTERLRITSAGLVGIGTSSPSNLLTLNAPNANALTLFVGSGTGEYSSIRGKYGAGNDYAQSEIRFINADNPNGRGALAFAVGTNSTTEHMRITYDGKVGIGTTSPQHVLDVKGQTVRFTNPGGAVASLEIGDGATGNQYAYIDLVGDTTYTDYGLRVFRDNTGPNAPSVLYHRGTGALGFNAVDSGPIVFVQGIGERARIDSAGRLGIGTTSPDYTVDINGELGITEGQPVTWHNGSGSPSGQIFCTSGDEMVFRNTSIGLERMRIDSSGRVGIGTTSPPAGALLAVNGQTWLLNENALLFMNADNTLGCYINGAGASGVNPDMVFSTSYNERARIDSSGRLLVGTSSAYAVEGFNRTHYFGPSGGESDNQIVVSATGTGTPGFFFTRTRGATPTTYTVVQNGDNLGILQFLGADGTDYSASAASILAQVDGTPGANDMPGRLVFSTTADGASSPTERMRITSGGAVLVGTTDTTLFDNTSGSGIVFDSVGAVQIARSAEAGLFVTE